MGIAQYWKLNKDDSVFLPLKSFTKKPVYDNNGLAHYSNGDNENICDPYCTSLTTLVTFSPESCHSNSGEAVNSCDYKGENFLN